MRSRLIWAGPSSIRMSASCDRGRMRPPDVGTRMPRTPSRSSRASAPNRTCRGNRACPSSTSPTTVPPIASTTARTSAALMP